ncbi:MAG: metal-dependent hydrolase [Candidatus Moraniibacteriota bacterium]
MFFDIKLGVLWAILVGLLFGEPITPWWILAGVFFALFPDIDFWIEYIQRGTVGGKVLGAHRTLLHNPLTYIPVVIITGTFFGSAWMTLASIGLLGHFIHDTMGMGFGVRWLWPFSLNFYKIFSDRAGAIHYDYHHLSPVSWTPAELANVIREKGNDNWLSEDLAYMRLHVWNILFSALLFAVVLYLFFLLRATGEVNFFDKNTPPGYFAVIWQSPTSWKIFQLFEGVNMTTYLTEGEQQELSLSHTCSSCGLVILSGERMTEEGPICPGCLPSPVRKPTPLQRLWPEICD